MTIQLIALMDINRMGEIALLMFLLIFLGVAVWAFSRTREEMQDWSHIPLGNDGKDRDQEQP